MPDKANEIDSQALAPKRRSEKKASQSAASQAQKEALGADLAALLVNSVREGTDIFQGFTGLTQQLKKKQEELDLMAADSLPAAILTDYVSDVLLPNSSGDLVSIVAENINQQSVVTSIYKRLALPAEKIIYSLLKNGIAIGEFEQASQRSVAKQVSATEMKSIDERILDIFDSKVLAATESTSLEATYVRSPGTILPNISIIQDTYTVFPIIRYEKCVGYLEVKKSRDFFNDFNWESDNITYSDVVIHQSTDYCYETFGVSHTSKPLQLRVENEDSTISVYDVAVGHSILEDAYTAWRTLSLLQDSVVLASLIKNAQIMLVDVEAGTATKQQIEAAKIKLRSLFEGQLAMGQQGMKSYLSPQSKPAYIYSFSSKGVGKITANLVGGEYNPGQLYYLTPFVNQFFAAMRAPKQNYGFTEGAGGLDGGGAVEQYNQRYKSTVQRLKRIYASFIKKAINNVLMSKGLTNLVDSFDVKVYGAYDENRNQEAQEMQTKLSLYESIITFMKLKDEDSQQELRSLMLKEIVTNPQLMSAIDKALSKDREPTEEDSDDVTPIEEMDDSQLSDDVAAELGVEDEGGLVEVDSSDSSDADIELPEMSDTLTGEDNG